MLESNAERKYQDPGFARRYLGAYQGPIRLRTLPARIIAQREQSCVENALHGIVPPPGHVLDMPCGTGKLGKVLTKLGVAKVTAADLSSAMMEQARWAYQKDTRFVSCDATKTPFSNSAFDTVICLRLMHLLPLISRQAVLKELARVSSQYVIISFGVLTPFQRFRLKLRRRLFSGKSALFPIDEPMLLREVKQAGLRIVVQRYILPGLSCERLLTLEKI